MRCNLSIAFLFLYSYFLNSCSIDNKQNTSSDIQFEFNKHIIKKCVDSVRFSNTINKICVNNDIDPSEYPLLSDSLFIQIAINSKVYLNDAIWFLSQRNLFKEKKVVALTMQTLDFDNYLYFLHSCLNLNIEKKIPDEIIQIVLGICDWNIEIYKNYKNSVLQSILNSFIKQKEININIKNDIKLILNGKQWSDCKINDGKTCRDFILQKRFRCKNKCQN